MVTIAEIELKICLISTLRTRVIIFLFEYFQSYGCIDHNIMLFLSLVECKRTNPFCHLTSDDSSSSCMNALDIYTTTGLHNISRKGELPRSVAFP